MKTLAFALFALVISTAPAFADWGRRPPPGHGNPGWGRDCTVTFRICRVTISGYCVKWSGGKSMQVPRRDARWGCQIAEQQHGQIKDCNVSCQ